MNNIISKFVIFVIGAAAGSVATYKLVKEKYEQIAREDIESVKDAFRRELRDIYNASADTEKVAESDREEYSAKVSELGYDGNEEEKNMGDTPYVISPEEFGTLDGYEEVSLNYYEGDEILTDDFDNPIINVVELVGEDFADHFGEYEDDSVFVRNDRIKTDYEILLDVRRYMDIK